MRRPRCWASAAIALGLLAGCTEPVTTGADLTDRPTSSPSTQQATPSPAPSRRRPSSPSPSPASTMGTLRIVVQDEDDLEPRSGVPITYRGPRSGTLTSGPGGVVAVRVPEGTYRLQALAGCHARLEIFRASGGTAGVVAGSDPTPARLTVQARRRYWGGPPIQHDVPVPWPSGTTVRLRYRLFDRCKDREAPKVAIDDVRYRTSSNLEVVGAPARAADGSSDVVITLRCRAAGDAELTMFDPQNPDDATDLLRLRPPSFEPNDTWCGT